MRKPGISFVLGLVAVVSAVETPAQSAVPVTLIKAGRLLDPRTGNVLSPAAVLIANGKIKEVGPLARVQPNVPAGAKTIDLGSATLLPGLIDSHTHLLMDNIVYVAEAERARDVAGSHRPAGYRWCVAIVPETPGPTAFAVGPTGMDYSIDGGKNWDRMNEVSANTVAFADAHHGWAIGRDGLILKFEGAVPR
jgi:hypothetical protein